MHGLEPLMEMEYPGRFIVMGRDSGGIPTVVYGITVRSPPNQARRLVPGTTSLGQRAIMVDPLDPADRTRPDAALLFYPALIFNQGIIVGNGAQTASINEYVEGAGSAYEPLIMGHAEHTYEPDPNKTPRISGYLRAGTGCSGAFGIIRKSLESDAPERHFFGVPLDVKSAGRLLTTYNGKNTAPVPSFDRMPIPVKIKGASPEEIADHFYNALAKSGDNDIRVSVAVAQLRTDGRPPYYIRNRHA